MRVGVLTGGGDCPGLNAVIRAIVRRCIRNHRADVVGFLEGWRGPMENIVMPLTLQNTGGLINRGGTILKTSRTNPFRVERGPEKILEAMERNSLDALIAVGGEDTCSVAYKMHTEYQLPVVCVPKTIDNDVSGTDFTFGFDTAVNVVMEALDRLHTTAESHNRVLVCEVMGRHAGWIALYGGVAGGADYIAIPEKPINMGELLSALKMRHARGSTFSILVIAEGAKLDSSVPLPDGYQPPAEQTDEFGNPKLGGIGDVVAKLIEKDTGYETRSMTLGHIQRGGTPTAFDRVLATRFGVRAADLVHEQKFGTMCALSGNQIINIPLQDTVGKLKTLDLEIYDVASVFFG